jgi:hypothetical protein
LRLPSALAWRRFDQDADLSEAAIRIGRRLEAVPHLSKTTPCASMAKVGQLAISSLSILRSSQCPRKYSRRMSGRSLSRMPTCRAYLHGAGSRHGHFRAACPFYFVVKPLTKFVWPAGLGPAIVWLLSGNFHEWFSANQSRRIFTAPSSSALQISENGFAVQVVLGMSKNNRECLSEDRAVRLIG